MCIVAFAWQAHPLYPLILIQNRDEYHNRPTKPLGWWEDEPEILGGRDIAAGGTWLACSRQGRIAFITNVLELDDLPDAKTRGDLPVLFLKSAKSPMEFAEEVAEVAHNYNGFNLIVGDMTSRSMVYVSNRPKDQAADIQMVAKGIHVLSNAKLDTPWPKALHLGMKFRGMINRCGGGELPVKEMVEELLRDRAKAEKSRLPGICSPELELSLSSVFVALDTSSGPFGTRSSAVVTVKTDREVVFHEKYLDKDVWMDNTVGFHIQKPQWM